MKIVPEISKVWLRFTKTINGEKVKFRFEQLPHQRYQEFIDFKMKYYVTRELTHVIADDDTNKLLGFDSMKIYRKGEIYKDTMPAKASEVQNFYKILHEWNNLCPVPDVVTKYGVDSFFDDCGFAIHPDYKGCRFTQELSALRQAVCRANGIPLTGGWMTSTAVQISTEMEGWETLYEISSEKLGNLLGIKLIPKKPQVFVYRIKRIV